MHSARPSHPHARLFALCILTAASTLSAAELKLLLPQGRTAFGTNEWIDVSVVRSDAQPLPGAASS